MSWKSVSEEASRETVCRMLSLFDQQDSRCRRDAVLMLYLLMNQGPSQLLKHNFRRIFKHLNECRIDGDAWLRRHVFTLLSSMFATFTGLALVNQIANYVEQFFVMVLCGQRDADCTVFTTFKSNKFY